MAGAKAFSANMPAEASKTFLIFKVQIPFFLLIFSLSPFEHLKGASKQCCVTYACFYIEIPEVVYPGNHNALKTVPQRCALARSEEAGARPALDFDANAAARDRRRAQHSLRRRGPLR
ncbi:hypothetical protein [Bradyrhizobium sp. USDA 3364]